VQDNNLTTILLTGCAGFIGSHTTKALLKKGYNVIGIDDLNDYYNPEYKQENLNQFKDENNFTYNRLDITNQEALGQLFQKQKEESQPIKKIVHLAARAGVRPSIAQPVLYQQVNTLGTLHLLELARQHQVEQFILASTSAIYGNQEKIPFNEDDPVNQPVSPYASTKKAAELLCYTYSHLYQLKTTCLRFFTVYGPSGRPDMAPYLFTKALLSNQPINKFGDGSSKRDYTYIDDIVAGVVSAVEKPFEYEIINLGNNNPVSLNEFIATLEEITGQEAIIKQLPTQPGDVRRTYADITKAKQLLNFDPKTSLKDGLSKFVEWYRTNRL